MAGIDECLKDIDSAGDLICDSFQAYKDYKNGNPLKALTDALRIFGDLKKFENVANALPELKDLDPKEAGQLTAEAYITLQRIMTAIKS